MSAMPRYDTINFSWLMKSTPVAYSVSSPTPKPNMTQRPFVISFFGVHPNTLHVEVRLVAGPQTDSTGGHSARQHAVSHTCQLMCIGPRHRRHDQTVDVRITGTGTSAACCLLQLGCAENAARSTEVVSAVHSCLTAYHPACSRSATSLTGPSQHPVCWTDS